jgi:hypothetical protein
VHRTGKHHAHLPVPSVLISTGHARRTPRKLWHCSRVALLPRGTAPTLPRRTMTTAIKLREVTYPNLFAAAA